MMEILINAGIAAVKPEIFLCISTILMMLFGLYRRPTSIGDMPLLGLYIIIATGILTVTTALTGTFMNGMFVSNTFTVFAKILILVSAGLVLMISSGFMKEEGGRPFEFIILVLFATLGMMLMVSSGDFLSLYMSLEMSSLALYVLAAFNRDNGKSNEAGLKYFVLGSLASGMLLFGISLVYGFAGSTNFAALGNLFSNSNADAEIAQLYTAGNEFSKGVILGLVLIIVGFCFKLSAVPFHMWTPDVYEGSPSPVTAFFATAPKIAALALFTRVLLSPFASLAEQWQQIVIFVSLASMLVGALGAIMQTNIKRLLAYSSIGHVGFMLMALAAGNLAGVQSILIYLAVYVFMSVGMFGVVLMMRRGGSAVESIKDLAGLSQTSPALAIAISILIFSMAGIPPMSGFFGKFYVVLAAVEAKLAWLAVAGVVTSVVSCYYYLKIIKTMYFDEPAPALDTNYPVLLRGVVLIGTAVTMLFFLVPTELVNLAKLAAMAVIK